MLQSEEVVSAQEQAIVLQPPAVTIYTDGGARGNPGPAAIGVVVCDRNDNLLEEFSGFIGRSTNNEAEYRALIKGLEMASKHSKHDVLCVSDSELIVRQMKGEYRVRKSSLRPLYEEAKARAALFARVDYLHKPRLTGWLRRADMLVNEELERPRTGLGRPGMSFSRH